MLKEPVSDIKYKSDNPSLKIEELKESIKLLICITNSLFAISIAFLISSDDFVIRRDRFTS